MKYHFLWFSEWLYVHIDSSHCMECPPQAQKHSVLAGRLKEDRMERRVFGNSMIHCHKTVGTEKGVCPGKKRKNCTHRSQPHSPICWPGEKSVFLTTTHLIPEMPEPGPCLRIYSVAKSFSATEFSPEKYDTCSQLLRNWSQCLPLALLQIKIICSDDFPTTATTQTYICMYTDGY